MPCAGMLPLLELQANNHGKTKAGQMLQTALLSISSRLIPEDPDWAMLTSVYEYYPNTDIYYSWKFDNCLLNGSTRVPAPGSISGVSIYHQPAGDLSIGPGSNASCLGQPAHYMYKLLPYMPPGFMNFTGYTSWVSYLSRDINANISVPRSPGLRVTINTDACRVSSVRGEATMNEVPKHSMHTKGSLHFVASWN